MKIRTIALVSLTMAVFLVTEVVGQRGGDELLFRVRIETSDPGALKATLEAAGYDLLQVDPVQSTVEVVVTRAELRALQRSGLSVVAVEQGRPLRENIQRLGVKTFQPQGANTVQSLAAAAAAQTTYRDLDGVVNRMYEIEAAYPLIAQVVDLTTTYGTPPTTEGRHLFALKISDNVSADEDEPAVLIVGNHHAREIVTPVIALEAAERLTAGYDSDQKVISAVNSAVNDHEIWIAPVWNPDGYNHVFTTNNLWRKNRTVFGNGVGVDLNRNYPQGWQTSCAGSTSVGSDTYKGPSPASEAETRTMMTWSQRERFAKVIDYHSSGREVLYSYRCLNHPLTSWMQQEAAALSRTSGYGGATRAPSAEGEHYEWQLALMGAYAFLIETHTEFQPPYDSAVNEAIQLWPGILSVIERPISIWGHVTDATTGAPLEARIEILNLTFPNGETNRSGGMYGSYHMFLRPGMFDVRFSREGYASVVVTNVDVSTSSSTELNIALPLEEPEPPAPPDPVVFFDDFETDKGWTTNPDATDTATTGHWGRGDPQSTSSSGPKQLGTTVSGVNDLVTGRLAGSSSGTYDIDGGRTSIQSAAIDLPSAATLTLSFKYYLAHGSNSSNADFLRVTIVSDTRTTVFEELGAVNDDDAAWGTASVNLSAFAGQTIRILIEAADAAGASLVEAAIDDVRIIRE